jgi:predicted AlkP superfamily pyrophosphatase or phosphodiesterase
MRKLMRECLRFLVALPLAALILAPAGRAAETGDSPRAVVMISVDGLAGFYFDDPKAEMPKIHEMAVAGACAPLMQASTPSVTWPNHTSLVTGVTPAKHGVVGNNYFDRSKGKAVALISDSKFDKEKIVKVPTVYDVAKAAGMKTLSIRWPATRNAKSIDWVLPDMKPAKVESFTTPALVSEAKEAGLWPKPTTAADGTVKPGAMTDELCTDLFIHMLYAHQPQFALLHIIDVDHVQHQHGPRTPEAYAAIKAADAQVGRVWEEVKKVYGGNATLIVVSDHGFSPVTKLILPNVILRDGGLLALEDDKTDHAKVAVVKQGGAAMIYILDASERKEIAAKVKELFSKVDEVASVVDTEHLKDYGVADPQTDSHAPDMVIFAKEGFAFGDTAAGAPSCDVRRVGQGN